MMVKSHTLDSIPIVWELPSVRGSFQCFAKGCKNQAVYVAMITQGVTTIQVCLCEGCRQKPLSSILADLGAIPDKMIH
jgi:hypothetical protein